MNRIRMVVLAVSLLGSVTIEAALVDSSSAPDGNAGPMTFDTTSGPVDSFDVDRVDAQPFAIDADQGTFFSALESRSDDFAFDVAASSSPVPLPAAAWLLASGLAGLSFLGRRRSGG